MNLKTGLLFAALAPALFWPVFFRGETLIAADILAASPVWRAAPGPIRNPYLSDTVEYYYPSEKLYSESVRRGRIPLVNPYLFNGAPVPHGIHIWNSIWPVKLAFLLAFDPVRSYDFFAIFHLWLAGVAFAALARSLGCSPFAAFAAALAYALSGRSMLWLHGHYLMATMAYAPLVFAFRGSTLAALPLAGLFFTNPHAGIAVSAAVLFMEPRSWKAVAGALLLSAVVCIPLAAAVLGGVRHPTGEARFFYADGWRCWGLLAGLVVPGAGMGSMAPNEYNVYLGLLPLAGAILGVRRARPFAILAGVALAAATLWPLPVWLAPVSFSLPTRWLFLFTLGGCVCFACALDRLPSRRWMQAAVLALVLADLVPRFVSYNATSDPSILRERPPAVAALRGRTGWVLGANPTLGRPVLPPLSLFGVESIQGYDVMVPRAQAKAIEGAGEVSGGRVITLTRPESPVLDELGMKYLLTDAPLAVTRYREVYSGSVRVYENPSARDVPPRVADRRPLWAGLAVTLLGCILVPLVAWRWP